MKIWTKNPAAELETVFGDIARSRMADVPICNVSLQVEAVDFRRDGNGHWVGAMITPWAINLLCLPGSVENWPPLAACAKHDWQFPSGNYEFTVAGEARLGVYHLCSLFSPALEFESHDAARLTALAAVHALFAEPLGAPELLEAGPAKAPNRRAFLGLRP